MTTAKFILDNEGAFTLDEFCARYSLSRAGAYREICARRLTAKKRGKRTVIVRAEAQRWFADLPRFESRRGTAAAKKSMPDPWQRQKGWPAEFAARTGQELDRTMEQIYASPGGRNNNQSLISVGVPLEI